MNKPKICLCWLNPITKKPRLVMETVDETLKHLEKILKCCDSRKLDCDYIKMIGWVGCCTYYDK